MAINNNISQCRICGGDFFDSPLLSLENVPSSAQNLPTVDNLDEGIDYNIYQCRDCGVVQGDNETVSYYREATRSVAYSEAMKNFRLEQFRDFRDKYGLKGKSILEIGAGKGEYVKLLAEAGMGAIGIESSDRSAAEAGNAGLPVMCGYLGDDDPGIRNWSAFCSFNFLEHCPKVVKVLKNMRQGLTKDGVGLVEVPNFDMMLQDGMMSEFVPDHLFYFTAKTFSNLLNRTGFNVLSMEAVCDDYILSAEVQVQQQTNLSNFEETHNSLVRDINFFSAQHNKIAIYGAGHQSFMILSSLGLNYFNLKEFVYIIDDAPFKQGKLSPVSHLPIVSLEGLLLDPPEAIIVIGGGYSDEMVKKSQASFPGTIVAVVKHSELEVL